MTPGEKSYNSEVEEVAKHYHHQVFRQIMERLRSEGRLRGQYKDDVPEIRKEYEKIKRDSSEGKC